jgi:endonuclease/exonuclease/phosphatase (EEP) superfamily protein YafD
MRVGRVRILCCTGAVAAERRSNVDALAWGVAGLGTAVLATQISGWNRTTLVAIGQSFTPLLAAAAVPTTVLAVARRKPLLAVAGAVAATGLGAIVAPALRRPARLDPAEAGRTPAAAPATLRIFHGNLLFQNERRAGDAAAAVLATGADVLALSELTDHHRTALLDQGGADKYPYRYDKTAKRSEGIALWSTLPVTDLTTRLMDVRPGLVATVETADGPIRVVLAHPDPPTSRRGLRRWESSLDMIGSIVTSDGPPSVLVADLNASRWHPPFRRLLALGLRDAHEAGGRGLSGSWPTGNVLVPPFVRLDHALVGPGISVVHVDDVIVPGSDHRGFVVTVCREESH